MAEEIKKEHAVMIVVTQRIEFIAHTPGIDGSPPQHKPAGMMQWQGGGAIVPRAWVEAKEKGEDGELIKQLLRQVVDQLPEEVCDALRELGQNAYEGKEPSRLVKPGMRDTLAMQGAQVRKVKPS